MRSPERRVAAAASRVHTKANPTPTFDYCALKPPTTPDHDHNSTLHRDQQRLQASRRHKLGSHLLSPAITRQLVSPVDQPIMRGE